MAIKQFNSVGGFSVGEVPANVIYANGDFAGNKANFTGNVAALGLLTDNLYYANGTPWDFQEAAGSNTELQFNMGDNFAASANLTFDDTTQLFKVLGNGQFNNANLGNLAIANFINTASNITTSNLTVNLAIAGNTASFSGNVILPNLTVNTTLSGNVANFSGNLTALNANLGNLATANYVNVANDINVVGNVTAANLVGALANGNSNVLVYSNSNVQVSIGGVANVATFAGTEFLVVGEIKTTAGNMLSNGNVTANGFLNGANANVSGEALLGSVKTAVITAPSGNITISAAGTNENIVLIPTGTGAVDVSLKNIIQLADPVNPRDAATKEYVDNTAQGLTIHTAVRVTSTTNLNATYANGGSVLSTIAITGGKTIQFSAAHNLSIGDEVSWDNSFNGIISDDPYFVYSTPAADTITVKAGYFGAEVTTLTNGTGLTQTARANTGVGATLTNAGANAAISIDSVSLSSTNRVLVQGQTNQVENGIYTVTTVGDGSTAWVLTRATDEDTYSPTATNALGYGDYFFVQNGSSYAGSSYVVTSPIGEILFGYTNIGFSQFSAAGSYSAGNGIAITGTTISANVDGVTTDIVGGNIVVKTSAQLTTPNIGAATGTSLNVTGNVDANNLSIGNLANVTGNLTVGGNIFANYAITANANVSGANITTGGVVVATGNVTGGNITTAGVVAATGNVSGGNLTTAGVVSATGNVSGGNITTANGLYSNTANVTGNAAVGGILTDNYYYANGAPVDFQQAAGANTQVQFNSNNDFGASANFTFNTSTNVLTISNGNVSTGNLIATGVLSVTGNANVGNLGTAGLIVATGNVTGGNLVTAGVVSATGNVSGGNITTGGVVAATGNVSGGNLTTAGALAVTGNANVGNLGTGGLIVATGNVTGGNLVTAGVVSATGNITGGNLNTANALTANTIIANTSANIGNTKVGWGTVTTTSITANQTIAQFSTTGIAAIEFLVKGVDSTGSKYSAATVTAVTDGTNVDYVTYATAFLGAGTGALSVNITSGNVALQVTPASGNSTVWTTQYRVM